MDDKPPDDVVSSDAADEDELTNICGIVAELGTLGSGAIVTEEGVARMFKRHPASVKRAVQRGELPPPIRMFGQNTWTVGALVVHVERRLAQAADEAEKTAAKIRKLSP